MNETTRRDNDPSKGGRPDEATGMYSPEEALGVEQTRETHVDTVVMDGLKKRVGDLAASQGVLTMDDIRGVLTEDVLKGMDDWHARAIQKHILRVVRELDVAKTGEALKRKTESVESGGMTAEEAQTRFDDEAVGIRLMYDRDALADEMAEYVSSVRG